MTSIEHNEIPGVFMNDPEMAMDDLAAVQLLDDQESSLLWIRYVSRNSRHFMLLGGSEWPSQLVSSGEPIYQWHADWNANRPGSFSEVLHGLGIDGGSALIHFWMKETAVRTAWGVYCRNWMNFLYEDEGCILVLPRRSDALVLSNGRAWYGQRRDIQTQQEGRE